MTSLILMVEDSNTDVGLFRAALEANGLANPMVAVRDGEAAHRYFAGESPFSDREAYPLPRVLVLNLDAPMKDGYDILRSARDQPYLKEVLIVVLTALHDVSVIRHVYGLGANSFLVKPFRAGEMDQLVRAFPQYWMRK